jgi:hypothetical protein
LAIKPNEEIKFFKGDLRLKSGFTRTFPFKIVSHPVPFGNTQNLGTRMKNLKNLPAGLLTVIVVIALEASVLAYFGIQLGIGILGGESRAFTTAIALFAMVAAAAAWLFYVAFSLTRSKRWARSAALFWQLVMLAIASGSFTGQFGSQAIGWALVAPAVLVVILVFTKPVVESTLEGADPEDRA